MRSVLKVLAVQDGGDVYVIINDSIKRGDSNWRLLSQGNSFRLTDVQSGGNGTLFSRTQQLLIMRGKSTHCQ